MPRPHLIVTAALLALATLLPADRALAQSGKRCFTVPGIANCIEGRFREFWEQNGGLAVFGYPITAEMQETTANGTFLTQVFERARFEHHPEHALPYDVLLGQLGVDRLVQQGRHWTSFPLAAPDAVPFFVETGHAITNQDFLRYWGSHGLEFDGLPGKSFPESLALFGYPISEPEVEMSTTGEEVLTQWFERARFEDHGAQGVLLGLLGAELAPQAQPLRVLGIGFGQQGRRIGAAFVIQNPNPTQPLVDLTYRLSARDQRGVTIRSVTGSALLIAPGERLGFAETLELPASTNITRVTLETSASTAPDDEPLPALLSGEQAVFVADRSRVTGVINSRATTDLSNIRVSAIAYSATGVIVGGGAIDLASVPAGGQVPVVVPVTIGRAPARVEVFATQVEQSGAAEP